MPQCTLHFGDGSFATGAGQLGFGHVRYALKAEVESGY